MFPIFPKYILHCAPKSARRVWSASPLVCRPRLVVWPMLSHHRSWGNFASVARLPKLAGALSVLSVCKFALPWVCSAQSVIGLLWEGRVSSTRQEGVPEWAPPGFLQTNLQGSSGAYIGLLRGSKYPGSDMEPVNVSHISYGKNPAYGRHLISWRVRIVAPLPKRTETNRKEEKKEKENCNMPGVTRHMSHITWQVSHVTCQVSGVACRVSPVTNDNSPSLWPSPTMHSKLVYKEPKTQKNH